MKSKIVLSVSALVLAVAAILFSSFGKPQSDLFYYGFKEKIKIETQPGKFTLRFTDIANAKSRLEQLAKTNGFSAREWKDDRTAIIDFMRSDASEAIRKLQSEKDIATVQPLYKTLAEQLELSATDEILVRFNKYTAASDVERIMKTYQLSLVQKGELFYTFSVAKTANTLQIANTIMESGVAEFAHPNFYRKIELQQVPNDEFFGFQWNLNNTGQVINDGHTGTSDADIDAPEAWVKTMGSSSIVVAVIDEGVTSNHPDLPNTRQVRLNGSNFSSGGPVNDPSPVGNGNHGNACSGIVAATRNNGEGISGVAPNCKIMPIKILNSAATDANIANAITFAKTNGAQVISNSWGYSTSSTNFIPAIVTAIQDAVTNGRGGLGCVVVFAAQNTADLVHGINGYIGFPGNVNIAGVLTVGASDRYDKQANYSPLSVPAAANNQIVDIVAPSHRAYTSQIATENFEIWSMDIPGATGYNPQTGGIFLPAAGINYQSYTGRMGGTSAATPQVAGAAALLLSLNSSLTQQQVFNILTENADKVGGYTYNATGFSNQLGYGRLNLYRAVQKAKADLYMKDQSADAGIEPNPSTAAYYTSPDIWVRNVNDGGSTHQNPEAGQINYVYVKVRNRGVGSSSGISDNLKLYWAKASTGLSWTFPWTGATYNCAGNTINIGGQIGTQLIGVIPAAGSTTFIFNWTPPKPTDFQPCFGTDASHFCLLARIETAPASPYGMAVPETTSLGDNVKNNNNIVWKNVSVVDLLPNVSLVKTSVLITGSKLLRRSFTSTDLAFMVPKEKGVENILTVADVDIDLGEFTKGWLNAGGKVEGGKTYVDDKGNTLIRISATTGKIYGVPIATTQMGSITLNIMPLKFSPGILYNFDIQQMDKNVVVGGERFDLQFKDKAGFAKTPATIQTPAIFPKNPLKVYQTGAQLNIEMNDGKTYLVTVANNFGQVFSSAKMTNRISIPTSTYMKGVYFVKLSSIKDQQTYGASVIIQ
jgi:subtilisin family serine protease